MTQNAETTKVRSKDLCENIALLRTANERKPCRADDSDIDKQAAGLNISTSRDPLARWREK